MQGASSARHDGAQEAMTPAASKGPRSSAHTRSPGGEGAPGAPRPGRAGKAPRESRQVAAAQDAAGKYRRGRRRGEYFPLTWINAKSPPAAAEGREEVGSGGEGGAGSSRSALPASGIKQDQTRRSGFEWLEIPVLGGSSPAEIPCPRCICEAPPPPPLTRSTPPP